MKSSENVTKTDLDNILPSFAGYSEACALGLNGICIVPSKKLFKLMLELFRRSVDSDHVPGIKSPGSGPGSGIKSPQSGGDIFGASYYTRIIVTRQLSTLF